MWNNGTSINKISYKANAVINFRSAFHNIQVFQGLKVPENYKKQLLPFFEIPADSINSWCKNLTSQIYMKESFSVFEGYCLLIFFVFNMSYLQASS